MGIGEVVSAIPAFLKKQKHLKQLISQKRPEAVLLVDFAEFNMGLAKHAHQLQIPVIYYIPPKAWAWRSRRAKKLAKTTSVVASIFPFEAEFYKCAGAHTKFVGNPLLDFARTNLNVEEARDQLGLSTDTPVLGLMPGSRRREVDALLPIMLDVAQQIHHKLPDCQFILPIAASVPPESLPETPVVKIVTDATYEAMRASDLMLVASGTATLEAACLWTPMIVVYKMSWLSWWVIKRLVKIDRSALPNIIAGHNIVPELLQGEVKVARLTSLVLDLLQNSEKRDAQRKDLREVCEQLGNPGAVERTAQLVLSYVE